MRRPRCNRAIKAKPKRNEETLRTCAETLSPSTVELLFAVIILLMIVVFVRLVGLPSRVTVFELERALRYTRGRFRDTLGPGQY